LARSDGAAAPPSGADADTCAGIRRKRRLIAAVRATLLEAPRTAASVVAGTLVGSLQLARALGDNAEGRASLS